MCDLIRRQDAIDAIEKNTYRHTYLDQIIDIIKALPSAQPEPCEDTISRQDAIRVASGYCHPANIAKELAKLPSAQPDMSEYSDKLWKAAYERGKAEAQPDLDEVYAHAETEAEARFHAQQRWIPCSERLPEPRKAVLGYAPRYQNIYALYYDSAYGWMIWNPLRDDCFPNSQGEIVAWMPLPEPYREEGD